MTSFMCRARTRLASRQKGSALLPDRAYPALEQSGANGDVPGGTTLLVLCRPRLNWLGGATRGGLVGIDARVKRPGPRASRSRPAPADPTRPAAGPSEGRNLWDRPLAVVLLLPYLWLKLTTISGSPSCDRQKRSPRRIDHCLQDFGNVKVSNHHHRLMMNGYGRSVARMRHVARDQQRRRPNRRIAPSGKAKLITIAATTNAGRLA